tara:strand:- start:242 stop:1432 length:1191 start_codon:yes stop_codon:yes gene_type:complete
MLHLLHSGFCGWRLTSARSSASMVGPDELTSEQHMELKEPPLLYLQDSAYVKLTPSPTAGVGVFALRDVPAAVDPFAAPNQLRRTLQAVPEGDELLMDYRFPDLYARTVAPRAARRASSPQMRAAPPAPRAATAPSVAAASRGTGRGGGTRLPNAAALVAALVVLSAAAAPTSALAAAEHGDYENYLPRLLYPGTYGNYCGPTPEFPRGWHGDQPMDAVDLACQRHDAAYDLCASQLRERRGELPVRPLLSVLVALRSTGLTERVLEAAGVDAAYGRCVHAADQGLIRDGLEVRGASQRAACVGDAFAFPAWFCELRSLTLARIERVDFDLFLADLDWDDRLDEASRTAGRRRLKELEAARRAALNRAATRMPLSRAAESVRGVEAEMLERLQRSP